jgi:hypothetical protein
MRTTALLAQASSGEEATPLDNIKTFVDIVGTSVTAVALIIGGVWAYFKFVKGRTYRPRLEVGLFGQWRSVDDKDLVQARITVKNIGASVVTLLQEGTGLRVSVLAPDQPKAPTSAIWERLKVFEILTDHNWIEPGETVSDDLMLDLGVSDPMLTLFEARLVWRWSRPDGNIVVFARQIIPVDSTVDGLEKGHAGDGQGKETAHERAGASWTGTRERERDSGVAGVETGQRRGAAEE